MLSGGKDALEQQARVQAMNFYRRSIIIARIFTHEPLIRFKIVATCLAGPELMRTPNEARNLEPESAAVLKLSHV